MPVNIFFDRAGGAVFEPKETSDAPSPDFVTEFLADADSHKLVSAFMEIKAADVRRSIVRMVEAISESRA